MSDKKEPSLKIIIAELREQIKHFEKLQKSTYYPDQYEDLINELKDILKKLKDFEAEIQKRIEWNKEQAKKWEYTFEPESALICEGKIKAYKEILGIEE